VLAVLITSARRQRLLNFVESGVASTFAHGGVRLPLRAKVQIAQSSKIAQSSTKNRRGRVRIKVFSYGKARAERARKNLGAFGRALAAGLAAARRCDMLHMADLASGLKRVP
jgi:hypothetical protein